jgi:excisionase family DNA binding protein
MHLPVAARIGKQMEAKMQTEPIVPRGKSIEATMTELNVSRATVNRLLASDRLRAVKVGSKTLVTTESIDAFWRSLPAATFRAPKAA